MVTRLCSDGQAVKADSLGALEKVRFILSWTWVGFMTYLWTIKEMAVMFYGHGLRVRHRPEPLKGSMGRLANKRERQLEVFRQYLQHLVGQSPDSAIVKYIPSGILGVGEEVFSSLGVTQSSQDC